MTLLEITTAGRDKNKGLVILIQSKANMKYYKTMYNSTKFTIMLPNNFVSNPAKGISGIREWIQHKCLTLRQHRPNVKTMKIQRWNITIRK